MAGYSRLMSLDERATVAALDAARAVFRAQIEANRGRVIDMAGDAVLAVFETAAGAVSAALAVQQALAESVKEQSEDRRMRFRIVITSYSIHYTKLYEALEKEAGATALELLEQALAIDPDYPLAS